jgi:hypothetical protein
MKSWPQTPEMKSFTLQYSIPSYRRKMLLYQAVVSVYTASRLSRTKVLVSDNNTGDPHPGLQDRSSLFAPLDITYISTPEFLPICRNWQMALSLDSCEIAKLLFSDDQLLSEPADDSLVELLSNPNCAAVVSPVHIGFASGTRQSYNLGDRTFAISSVDYIDMMLNRPDLVSSSPCAFYFRTSEVTSALRFCLSEPELELCRANGAGIDTALIATILARPDSFIIYDHTALVYYGAGENSITMADIKRGGSDVSIARELAKSHLFSTTFGCRWQKFQASS